MEKVLLTGITGYIGQHCAAELLRQGYEVLGTFRSTNKAAATKQAIAKVAPTEKLSLVELDLLSDAGWFDAMKNCKYVVHMASPFFLKEPIDEKELIEPAVQGTLRVIEAAKRNGIKRVVLTSSTFAISAGKETGKYGPNDWSDSNAKIGAYANSKTLAERAAWDAVKGSELELTVINPGAVFGPSLEAKDGQNVTMMRDMIAGKMPMYPDMAMGMIDVRDVAKLHASALTAKDAASKRFIACSAEPIEIAKLSSVLRDAGYKKAPAIKAPTFVLRFISLFDREAKGMMPFIEKKASYDITATLEILNWKPTDMPTSFRDMAKSISN
jgi:dihydroflavonol-4-reductase